MGKRCGKCIKIEENRNGGLETSVLTVLSIFKGSSYTTIMFGQVMRELTEDISGGMAETEGLAAEDSKSCLTIQKVFRFEAQEETRGCQRRWPGPC